jgi:replicative DNA helicase
LFIYREDVYNENSLKPGRALIKIDKHRNGPTGSIELYFEKERSSFRDMEKGEYSEYAEGE